jgi:ATP-dependent DNA helicase DinG
VVRARRLAREAQLVVVNHALLLSDQAADGALIGPFANLVVDEAHRLPQVMLDAGSVRLDHNRLLDLEDLLGAARAAGQSPEVPTVLAGSFRSLDDQGSAAATAAESFGLAANRCLRAYRTWWRLAGEELAPGAALVAGQRLRIADKDVAFAPLQAASAELLETTAAATAAVAHLAQRTDSLPELPGPTLDLLARCAQAGELLDRLQRDVRFVVSDPSDRWVTWLEPGPARRSAQRWAPRPWNPARCCATSGSKATWRRSPPAPPWPSDRISASCSRSWDWPAGAPRPRP